MARARLNLFHELAPTKTRRMELKLSTATLAAFLAVFLSPVAVAENYGGNSEQEQIRMKELIYQYFGNGWVGRVMVCIARKESGLNPRATNYYDTNGGSYGLMQNNAIWRRENESVRSFAFRMQNPHESLRAALKTYRVQGLHAWTTARAC